MMTIVLIRKSPWPGGGQIVPVLAKVPSATDLGQPSCYYLKCTCQFHKYRLAKVKVLTPYYSRDRLAKVRSATDRGQDRDNLSSPWPR